MDLDEAEMLVSTNWVLEPLRRRIYRLLDERAGAIRDFLALAPRALDRLSGLEAALELWADSFSEMERAAMVAWVYRETGESWDALLARARGLEAGDPEGAEALRVVLVAHCRAIGGRPQ